MVKTGYDKVYPMRSAFSFILVLVFFAGCTCKGSLPTFSESTNNVLLAIDNDCLFHFEKAISKATGNLNDIPDTQHLNSNQPYLISFYTTKHISNTKFSIRFVKTKCLFSESDISPPSC
jgi:hypothetical protein